MAVGCLVATGEQARLETCREHDCSIPFPLTPEDHANLESAREWVRDHFTEFPLEKYEPISGKLRVVQAILENKWVQPNETVKLHTLGVTLGDALAQELMLEWVMVDDEYGRTAALNWPGTSIYSYPITMISKRIEDDANGGYPRPFQRCLHPTAG